MGEELVTKMRTWMLKALAIVTWTLLVTYVGRFVIGLPSLVNTVILVMGGTYIIFVWMNPSEHEGILKEFEEHEENMRISKKYDDNTQQRQD